MKKYRLKNFQQNSMNNGMALSGANNENEDAIAMGLQDSDHLGSSYLENDE